MADPGGKREKILALFLMVEIKTVQECMVEVYERQGSLKDPVMVQLSQIHERKLSELEQLVGR